MEHMIEACSFVQILDAPVPLGGNQLVVAFRHFDVHFAVQAVEVPKISTSPRRSRRRRFPLVQTAEQLVEVPAIVSHSSLHGLVEQNVDMPDLHGRGGGASLQGLRPGQSSVASSSHSLGAADEVFYTVFWHFAPAEKV